MALTKLTSVDAFVVTDIPDAPATGIVRMGKKILQSSAKDLARSATYTFAAFGLQRGGASAGINAESDEDQAAALPLFVDEMSALDGIDLTAGKGVRNDQLSSLNHDLHPLAGSIPVMVSGIVAAARWAHGGNLSGATAAVEGQGSNPTADLVASALSDAGADVVSPVPDAKPWEIWGFDVDLLLPGTKPGTLTHQGAGMAKAKAVVPWGPIPVTTKAYVMLNRKGVRVLPDFVAAAGGVVGPYLQNAPHTVPEMSVEVARHITDVLDTCAGHDEGVLMGACVRAEEFLGSWSDFSPFGRPLAA